MPSSAMAARMMSNSIGALGAIGLVHRDLGDEVACAFGAHDLAIDLAGLFDGGEKLLRGLAEVWRCNFESLVDAGELNAAE